MIMKSTYLCIRAYLWSLSVFNIVEFLVLPELILLLSQIYIALYLWMDYTMPRDCQSSSRLILIVRNSFGTRKRTYNHLLNMNWDINYAYPNSVQFIKHFFMSKDITGTQTLLFKQWFNWLFSSYLHVNIGYSSVILHSELMGPNINRVQQFIAISNNSIIISLDS